MMNDALTKNLVDTIVAEVHPEKILLFGSRARGDNQETSDADVIVITRESFVGSNRRWTGLSALYRALARFPIALDILLFSDEEVKRWSGSRNHVLGRALREGVVLYGRS